MCDWGRVHSIGCPTRQVSPGSQKAPKERLLSIVFWMLLECSPLLLLLFSQEFPDNFNFPTLSASRGEKNLKHKNKTKKTLLFKSRRCSLCFPYTKWQRNRGDVWKHGPSSCVRSVRAVPMLPSLHLDSCWVFLDLRS